jgi:thiol-disulfide isomerase/thioredoxin
MSPVHALVVLLAAFGGEPAGEVLEFSATYCGPCREMAPLVARLEREGLPIRKIDTQQDRELTERYNITGIPTFVLVVNGRSPGTSV